MFKIEKGIPLPEAPTRGGRRSIYPFGDLEIGDSFFVPNKTKMASTITAAGRKLNVKLVYRVQEENGKPGTRIWRVADDDPADESEPELVEASSNRRSRK